MDVYQCISIYIRTRDVFLLRLGLEASKHLGLLLAGLERSRSELGRGVDELDGDILQSRPLGLWEESLSQSDDPLLGSWASSLDHDIVLVDDSVVRESSHWGDVLLGDIKGGGGLVGGLSLDSDAVDLLVHLSTVVHTHSSGPCDGPCHSGWMPGSDASNLTETTMCLTWKTGDSPSGHHTLSSASLGDGNGINHLVVVEDRVDRDRLLEETGSKVDLLGDGSSVDLDLHDVSLLLGSEGSWRSGCGQ
jgi:hypothetical protein